jgi:hypothetical protein
MAVPNTYRQLRKVVLRGRSAKQRLAALNEMVASAHPPSIRLLDELLGQPDLPAPVVLAVMAIKRIFDDKENYEPGTRNLPDDPK